MSIKIIYVAGPFSASTREGVEANIRRAELLGLEVAKLGACPLIPHANTSLPEFEIVQDYGFWIEATKELLRRADAVIFTTDWERSSGARGENLLGAELLMPMFYTVEALADWLRTMASVPADRGARAEMATIPPAASRAPCVVPGCGSDRPACAMGWPDMLRVPHADEITTRADFDRVTGGAS